MGDYVQVSFLYSCTMYHVLYYNKCQTCLKNISLLNQTNSGKVVMYSTELYWAVLDSTGLNSTVLSCIGLYWAVLDSTGQNWPEQSWNAL